MSLSSVVKNTRPRCKDLGTNDEFCVLSVGKPFSYVIPSFDILAVKLRPMRVGCYDEDGEETVYDYFVRDDSNLCRAYPSWMKIKDLTIIDLKEFSKAIKTGSLKFPTHGVCVIWDWEWGEPSNKSESSDAGMLVDETEANPYMDSDSETEDSSPVHVVTFKCMGSNYDPVSQNVLKAVCSKLKAGETVPVEISAEPSNPVDRNAIAFVCLLNGKRVRIGYVVSQVLPYVHEAMQEGKIKFVKFSWVKYIIVWKSGPGYYAGIDIAKDGRWPATVEHYRSTRQQ